LLRFFCRRLSTLFLARPFEIELRGYVRAFLLQLPQTLCTPRETRARHASGVAPATMIPLLGAKNPFWFSLPLKLAFPQLWSIPFQGVAVWSCGIVPNFFSFLFPLVPRLFWSISVHGAGLPPKRFGTLTFPLFGVALVFLPFLPAVGFRIPPAQILAALASPLPPTPPIFHTCVFNKYAPAFPWRLPFALLSGLNFSSPIPSCFVFRFTKRTSRRAPGLHVFVLPPFLVPPNTPPLLGIFGSLLHDDLNKNLG